jgi:hypothetical protein
MKHHLDALTEWKRTNGGNTGLSARLNALNAQHSDRSISPQAISQWKQVPADRVIDVEVVTGISRHVLRPDLSAIFVEGGEAA